MLLARTLALAALCLAAVAGAAAAGEPAAFRAMSYNIRVDVPSDNPTWAERRPHMAA